MYHQTGNRYIPSHNIVDLVTNGSRVMNDFTFEQIGARIGNIVDGATIPPSFKSLTYGLVCLISFMGRLRILGHSKNYNRNSALRTWNPKKKKKPNLKCAVVIK